MLLICQIAIGSALSYYIVEGISFINQKIKSRKNEVQKKTSRN